MTLLDALAVLFAIHAQPAHVAIVQHAATEHHADLALVSAIGVRESGLLTRGRILMGAHLRRPIAECMSDPAFARRVRLARRLRRRPPLCINRDPEAQATFTARLFGGVARRHWPRMLAGYRCGPNAACQRGVGAAYAGEVIAGRDRIYQTMRRERVTQ